MENKQMSNSITIYGIIDSEPTFHHNVKNDEIWRFTLKFERKSGVYDYLPVMLSRRFIDDSNMHIGTTVKIEGQIRTYNYGGDDGSRHLDVYIFAKILIADVRIPEEDPQVVSLNGFVTRPITVRKTPKGLTVADMLIGVNRDYGYSDYIPCILWRGNAKDAAYLEVGDNIAIKGRLQSRVYHKLIDNVLVDKVAIEFSVEDFEVLALAEDKDDDSQTA